MFKVFALLKRRPGMTTSDFTEYYETNHAPLGVEIMRNVRYYARHYLTPTVDPVSGGEGATPAYDVITELHFDDRAGFDQFLTLFDDPEINARLAEDEAKLFDRSRNSLVIVDTCESKLPA